MSALIQKIQQALDKKAQVFIQQLQCIQPPAFPTKFNSKTRMNKGKVLSNKLEKELKYKVNRAYAIWSDFEDQSLITSFTRDNKSIEVIAKLHNRTPSAIYARLKKLKLIKY